MKEILQYGFGLRGCRHLSTRQIDGPIVIEPEKMPEGQELVRHG